MTRIRNLLAAGAILLAFAVLGLLLLVSTRPGDDAARRLDLSLRQAGEIAPRLVAIAGGAESGAVAAEVADVSALQDGLELRLQVANGAFDLLYPQVPSALEQTRAVALAAFDSIDARARERPGSADLRAAFAALNANGAVFGRRVEGLREALERWQRTDRLVADTSRQLIGELRADRDDAAADLIFRSVEQLGLGLDRGVAFGPRDAEQLVATMVSGMTLADQQLARRLAGLAAAMRELAPARSALRGAAEALREHPFPEVLTGLREQIGVDLVHRLSTLGDARVLLNVYTALLLLVLVYFALRLRSSHAALNRSHDDLEQRVIERTRDMEQAYLDLKESQVQLVQAEKMSSLGQLVAGVAHEINTPLMYVQSNVTTNAESLAEVAIQLEPALLLARELRNPAPDMARVKQRMAEVRSTIDPDELALTVEEIRQLAADSEDGLQQIAELVQSLKDFSRIDRAERDLFDVREGLEKTLTITRNLHKYGIEVVRNFQMVAPVSCSPSRINQVFINLVTNAVQAMDGQGRLELSTRQRGDRVEISVTDTGCGIAPEHLARVTDPFFTTKPVGQGTGLGLSIVRQIVDEHDGRLDIVSEPGVGTTITVSLPLQQATREEAA